MKLHIDGNYNLTSKPAEVLQTYYLGYQDFRVVS